MRFPRKNKVRTELIYDSTPGHNAKTRKEWKWSAAATSSKFFLF